MCVSYDGHETPVESDSGQSSVQCASATETNSLLAAPESEFISADSGSNDDKDTTLITHETVTDPQFTTTSLYQGSTISLNSSQLMIRSFIDRHHLSGQAKKDLLKMLSLHLPPSSALPTSFYHFHKQFCNVTVEPREYFYCGDCHMPLNEHPYCCNSFCQFSHIQIKAGTSMYSLEDAQCRRLSFVKMSIDEQLKTLLQRTSFSFFKLY